MTRACVAFALLLCAYAAADWNDRNTPALVSATVETNEADDPELVAWSEATEAVRDYIRTVQLPIQGDCR